MWVSVLSVKFVGNNPKTTLKNMTTERKHIDIELDGNAPELYSNLVIISHSASEFVLDFATVLPGISKAKVKSRVILAPEHAKRLLLSLQENVARYEATMGKIPLKQPNNGQSFNNMGEA